MYTTLGLALGGGEGQASCICIAPVSGLVRPMASEGGMQGGAGHLRLAPSPRPQALLAAGAGARPALPPCPALGAVDHRVPISSLRASFDIGYIDIDAPAENISIHIKRLSTTTITSPHMIARA
eukprot:scaffold146299_cov39-Tisochrysis_lutea.AAC.4